MATKVAAAYSAESKRIRSMLAYLTDLWKDPLSAKKKEQIRLSIWAYCGIFLRHIIL